MTHRLRAATSRCNNPAAFLRAFVLVVAVLSAPGARADLVWHWEDSFSAEEQTMLTAWLSETADAVQRWAGTYPFDVHLYLHRRDGAREPVPWANTWRNGQQAIHFHVDPTYPKEAFLADWTAPHEFAHLFLPYLGRSNAWAAEGFASYLQYVLMVELGVITPGEAERRRGAKMDRAQARLAQSSEPLPARLDELRAQRDYPAFYWGGAVFWERIDAGLREQEQSLQVVLRSFLDCCRMRADSFSTLVSTLDRVSASTIFSAELALMNEVPGCPARPEASGRDLSAPVISE